MFGEQYLRKQTPLHYASDDMGDASRDNIRNLKRTARELMKRVERALYHLIRTDHMDPSLHAE